MPLPITLAHKLSKRLTEVRKENIVENLRPDGKTQVTIEYEGDTPVRVDTVVISTQHTAVADLDNTYGGYARHGGGAFSGKDATKVDRSASYMARCIAKNIVANKLAKKCEIQLSYAIGVAKPVSIYVETFGTATIPEEKIAEKIYEKFDLTPRGIINYLNLRKPIYKKTTNYGHFGKTELPWEKIIEL